MRALLAILLYFGWFGLMMSYLHVGVIVTGIYVLGAVSMFFYLLSRIGNKSDGLASRMARNGEDYDPAAAFFYIVRRSIFWPVYLITRDRVRNGT